MKTMINTLKSILVFSIIAITIQACGSSDSGPKDLSIEAITISGLDLNGATSPTDVATDASIEITFNSDIKAETATTSNISLSQDYDEADVELEISVDGPILTITPVSALGTGILYRFELKVGLLNVDEQPLAQTVRTFTTVGNFSPAGMIANWTFENTADDLVGAYNPTANGIVDISYTSSRNAEAGNAATFNGNTSIIEIPGADALVNTDKFTVGFWVKTNSDGHINENGDPAGHFVMGLAAFWGFQVEIDAGYSSVKMPIWIGLSDGTTRGGGDMFWNGDGLTRDNEGWQGTTVNDEEDMVALTKDTWMQYVFTFDGAAQARSMYVNGELRLKQDFGLWPEGATERLVNRMEYGGAEPETYPELAFGFVHSRAGTLWDTEPWGGYDIATSNHFKGQLDDVKFYHKVLTDIEIQLMYDSEK